MSLRRAVALLLVGAGVALCAVAVLPYWRGYEAQLEGRRVVEQWPTPLPTIPFAQPTPGGPEAETTPPTDEREPAAPEDDLVAGQPVARLTIPAARIDAVVFEGVDAQTLDLGPGHLPRTERPGRTGALNNCVIVGHRDSHFRNLGWLRVGQRIELQTPEARQTYRVVSREVVGPDAVRVLAPSSSPRLTLITCYPFDYVGPAPRRLVVVAEPLMTAAAPGGRADRIE